jgi:hypothetical protein
MHFLPYRIEGDKKTRRGAFEIQIKINSMKRASSQCILEVELMNDLAND